VKYLSPEQVLFIHSRLIDETGGSHGLRDAGLLASAVARPQATFEGKDLYPDIFRKAAALMESLIKSHPFVDGNKRTAVTSAGIFLQMNGFSLEVPQKELVRFAVAYAAKNLSFDEAVVWFMNQTRRDK